MRWLMSMLTVLRLTGLRHLRAHKLRTVLTVIGAALGVAAIIAIRLVNDSASRSFEETVNRMAGRAVLEITNGEAGVPEELLDEVRVVPGVEEAAATVQGYVSVPAFPGERLYVFGVDLLVESKLRTYQSGSVEAAMDDPLVFLAQPNSVALTRTFLERHGLHEGDSLRVQAPSGSRELVIRSTLDVRSGPATLFSGRVAVMDVFAAQRLFALDKRFTQIDVAHIEGTAIEALQAGVSQVVAGRGLVQHPRRRGEMLERLLAGNRAVFSFGAMLAIIVGLYLTFNTMLIAVAQRHRDIALLRMVGMRRRTLGRLIVGESLVVGTLGCLLGVPLGIGLARGMWTAFAASVSSRFVPVEATHVVVGPSALLWGIVLGLLSALVAAVFPAREALRHQPVEVIRGAEIIESKTSVYARSALIGLALIVAGTLSWVLRQRAAAIGATANAALQGMADLAALLGVSLVAPALVLVVARGVERWGKRASGGVVVLAARSIAAGLRRVSISATALVVSLVGAISIATVVVSLGYTVNRWLEANFSHIDLQVSTSPNGSYQDAGPLPQTLADGISALPGVARVNAERWVKVPYDGVLAFLVARDVRAYREGFRSLDVVDGDREQALAQLASGTGVVVSDLFARRFKKKVGDVVSLPSPTGEVALRIAAIIFDLDDFGVIIMDRAHYQQRWRDTTATFISLALAPGVDRSAIADRVQRTWGDTYGIFVITIADFRQFMQSLVTQATGSAYPLIAITIAIALIGIVNALLASVLDRVREFGILRAIGATRRQIALSVMTEAMVVGLAGAVGGAVVGSMQGYAWLYSLIQGVIGLGVFYRYPLVLVLFAFAAAVLLAAAAGYVPGRAASRISVAHAMRYE
jgi:putative ABC transport system permease protein